MWHWKSNSLSVSLGVWYQNCGSLAMLLFLNLLWGKKKGSVRLDLYHQRTSITSSTSSWGPEVLFAGWTMWTTQNIDTLEWHSLSIKCKEKKGPSVRLNNCYTEIAIRREAATSTCFLLHFILVSVKEENYSSTNLIHLSSSSIKKKSCCDRA